MSKMEFTDQFATRHIGPSDAEIAGMLGVLGCKSLDELIDQTVPRHIRTAGTMQLPPAMAEAEYLRHLKKVASMKKTFRSYIGRGYFGTITPSVILRNVFENPGWYTQYTPYQAEIAQGRLESLLNFQTMVSDLTGLPISNASLLDEATAAAEAMQMFFSERNKRAAEYEVAKDFFVDKGVLPQTLDVICSRAKGIGVNVTVGDWKTYKFTSATFGVLLQYPNSEGAIEDYKAFVKVAKENKSFVCVAADILSLLLLSPPGEWGADVAVGITQRFGVPIGFGGPHAAYFATTEDFKRQLPGRIIGVSVDKHGNKALRMALQTREQHIRREKATSNICTAQALLANMSAMYAVYHGAEGLRAIAQRINSLASCLKYNLVKAGYTVAHAHFFDTIRVELATYKAANLEECAQKELINLHIEKNYVQVSLDETVSRQDLLDILACFNIENPDLTQMPPTIPPSCVRLSTYLTHPVFNTYHTESAMMRYLKHLENKDLSLAHSMISLGSCTMKLNAATEMIPVSWSEFANLHPFVPIKQAKPMLQIINELSDYLSEITGFPGCSLQPNSGAQGEYAGLMVIRAFHEANNQSHRNIALIPSSAHGTNPASAVMAGMQVVVVKCDENGNIDLEDLHTHAKQNADNLACLMVTYPSTHGVFEEGIIEICRIIHQFGGKVYMDGANMNAQVGLTSPAAIGADVCHLNLHKTFAIPHGGGGPGVGPICCTKELMPFLPGHSALPSSTHKNVKAVSAAPYGSASILLISHAYIRLLGAEGLKKSTQVAILNANYIKSRLEKAYTPLYTGKNGRVAHELILDLRPFKAFVGAEDVAKRLIDYGFHAPTLSFPVAGTIMIEPTESENKAELDRFCDALLEIRKEIDEIAEGKYTADNNVLHNAPHVQHELCADDWKFPYSRQKAAFPLPYLMAQGKFWATVGRIDQAFGDRNLVCTCPPIASYQTVEA